MAKEKRRPGVALESTIYAFGLPYPRNVELGWKLARTIAATGAEAKTFAVVDGELRAGLTDHELDRIARGAEGGVVKLAASDLGPAMALGLTGATTVSATMALARGAGLRVFATGGIGGVHRDAEQTYDESQDLTALARYPVAVVSAGAKAILDLGKTMERLETLGVPVVGYQTGELPAFYTRSSGIKLALTVNDVQTLARVVHAHWRVHPQVGLLVANPIPEEHALPQQLIDDAIARALTDARDVGARGKALTPFLLKRLDEITEGRSVAANIALAENNARLAGELAVALHNLFGDDDGPHLVRAP
ncbi:MAG: pseudouridine-5'-phosphate glycosidase [Deltaproteobacteria bacterium]|nr:pseudouridine-5'-phosphate glycosidase [Deltaproteobacteria bacterium]